MSAISVSGSHDADGVRDGAAGYGDPVLTSTFEPPPLPSRPIIRARLRDRLSQGVQEKPLTL
jgi:hypothetical protein